MRAEPNIVRFEVFTTVTMKNVVFWDIKIQLVLHRRHITSPLRVASSSGFLITANFVPSSSILIILIMEGLSSSETSVLKRATRRNIPDDSILQSLILFINAWC
jgi:hypothetical protein